VVLAYREVPKTYGQQDTVMKVKQMRAVSVLTSVNKWQAFSVASYKETQKCIYLHVSLTKQEH